MSIASLAFNHRRAILFVTVMLLLGGILAYFLLPVSIFPALTIPRIKTIADAGDTPPEAMMVAVTKPIEQALATVPHMKRIRSTTARGETEITADFDWNTDMFETLSTANARIAALKSTLPPEAKVESQIMDPALFPIMGYSLTSPTRTQEDLYDLALYTIKPRLARIPGIRDIQVGGNRIREIRVSLNPSTLQANGISASDVQDALRHANLVTAVGQLSESYRRHLVLIDNRLGSVESVGSVVVTARNRVPIRIRDLGTVEMSAVPQNIVLDADGHRAVLLNILRQTTSNTVQIAQSVAATLDGMRAELPRDVTLKPFYDQSQIVQESEGSVRDAVLIGAILAGIVQLLFLGSLRSAGVVFLILPITVAATLLALLPLGRTLNIMTLGAVAIALGLVIDDAVVVVENIFRYLEEGLPQEQAVREAMHDIAPAMFGSSATTLVVFLPLLWLTGVTGNFFAPLALTMGIALSVSLLLSLFLIPLLAYSLLRVRADSGRSGGRRKRGFTQKLDDGYKRAIRWCLNHRTAVFFTLVPLAAAAVLLSGRLQTGFMPEMDEGGFTLDYTMPAGTSLTETDVVCRGIGRILMTVPDVSSYSRRTGTQLGFFITSQNTGDILVKLKPRSQRRPIDQVMDDLRDKINTSYPTAQIDFVQILQDMLGDLAGSPSPIEVKLFGPDMATLEPVAHTVGKMVSATKGVVDEFDGVTRSGPDDLVYVDSDRAAQAGLTPEAVSSQLNSALFGDVATTLRIGERQVGIRVSYPQGEYQTADALARLPVISPDGASYPLSAVARIIPTEGSTDLNRENQRLMVAVTARISGTDLGSAIRAIQAKVRAARLPAGVSVEYGGLFESQQQSFLSLGLMLGVVAFLTLAVLVFYFGTFADAIALLSAGILSLSGVILALWLTNTPLDISSFTGSIMVIGIVVEGSFFLLDSARQLRRAGDPPVEALVNAGGLRLRPILMTKLTAILTLFPLALGIGAGAEMQRPLAIAVIGGVLLSGLFTLFVTPTLYATLSRLPKAPRPAAPRPGGPAPGF